jgi:hypothetical protein
MELYDFGVSGLLAFTFIIVVMLAGSCEVKTLDIKAKVCMTAIENDNDTAIALRCD